MGEPKPAKAHHGAPEGPLRAYCAATDTLESYLAALATLRGELLEARRTEPGLTAEEFMLRRTKGRAPLVTASGARDMSGGNHDKSGEAPGR